MSNETSPVFNEIANQIIQQTKSKSVLQLNMGLYELFSLNSESTTINSSKEWHKELEGEKFDAIFIDSPLGQRSPGVKLNGTKYSLNKNWLTIYHLAPFLKENSVAMILVEPIVPFYPKWQDFEKGLNEIGLYTTGVLRAPQNSLSGISLRPNLLLIQKTEVSNVFLAEIENLEQVKGIIDNLFSDKEVSQNLESGLYIEKSKIVSFDNYKTQKQIQKLQHSYDTYKSYKLKEIAKIENINQEIANKENSIFISRQASNKVKVLDYSELPKKNLRSYFQIILDNNINKEYLQIYFGSELGQLALKSIAKGTVINNISKKDLLEVTVAIPDLSEQELISNTNKKLLQISDKINEFNAELALNPKSALEISNQLDNLLESLNQLTDHDKIRMIIREGESKRVEFKQTLSLDIKKQTKEKYIELAALKTIVAFLNSEGGNLLIGVNDEGNILGVENELQKFHKNNKDNYLKHFKNLMAKRIGEPYYPFIDQKLIEIDKQNVLLIQCKASKKPCYLDNSGFYVRTNPATDKLEGPRLVDYINNHFK